MGRTDALPGATAARPVRSRRVERWLVVLTLTVYGFTAGGSLTSSDATFTFDVARNIVEHHTTATSPALGNFSPERGVDGRSYAPFGLLQSLYDIPFYLTGRTAAALAGSQLGKSDTVPKAFVALGQIPLATAIVWVAYRLSLALTGSIVSSALAAVTLAFGSLVWPYAKFGFNQPLATVTLWGAVLALHGGLRRQREALLTMAGLLAGLALLTRHELMLGSAVLAGWLLIERGWPGALAALRRFLPGVTLGLGVWMIYNSLRFGNPFNSGQIGDTRHGFNSAVLAGLLGLLASPTTSVFLFTPMTATAALGVPAARRRDPALTGLLLACCAVLTLFYATLGNWIGGRSYGSRYLFILLPAACVGWAAWLQAQTPTVRKWAAALVLGTGLLVQVPGVAVDYAKISQSEAARRGGLSTEALQWNWRASPLYLNARALPGMVRDNAAMLLGVRAKPVIARPSGDLDRSFSQQFAFSLDFWWLYLFYLGVLPRPAVFAVIGIALVAIALATGRLRAAIRDAA